MIHIHDELRESYSPFQRGDLVRPRHTPRRPVGRVTRVDKENGKVAVDFGVEFRWWNDFELEHADVVSALGRLA